MGAAQRAGLVPIGHCSELIAIGRTTATGMLDRLEEAAPIERVLDRSERRAVKVRATARGAAALQDSALLSNGTIGERSKALSVAHQDQLAELPEAVIAAAPAIIAPSKPATAAGAAS